MNSKIVPTCKSSESVYDLFDRMEKVYGPNREYENLNYHKVNEIIEEIYLMLVNKCSIAESEKILDILCKKIHLAKDAILKIGSE
jgi:hypothetical protein